MLEPGASFAMAADGGRPVVPVGGYDIELQVGGRDANDALVAVDGFSGVPALGLEADGDETVVVEVWERRSNPSVLVRVLLWWSDGTRFSSSVPLATETYVAGMTAMRRVLPQHVRIHNVKDARSVRISLPSAVPFDIRVMPIGGVPLGPLSSATGVRRILRFQNGVPFALHDGMFKGCSSLRSVGGYRWFNIPSEAFRGCTSLEECPLGRSANANRAQYLGDMCFYGCGSMPGNGDEDATELGLSIGATLGSGCLAGCAGISLVTHSGNPGDAVTAYVGQYASCGIDRACPADPLATPWPDSGPRTGEATVSGVLSSDDRSNPYDVPSRVTHVWKETSEVPEGWIWDHRYEGIYSQGGA